jgi:hypothetical protein
MVKDLTAVRIEPTHLKILRRIAKETDRSLSGVVRLAVKEFIQRNKREGKS